MVPESRQGRGTSRRELQTYLLPGDLVRVLLVPAPAGSSRVGAGAGLKAQLLAGVALGVAGGRGPTEGQEEKRHSDFGSGWP